MMTRKFLYIITVLVLGVMFTSCENWDEVENSPVAAAPEVTLNLVSVHDSVVNVSVKTNTKGYVSLVIVTDSANALPDGEQLLTGNTVGLEQKLFNVRDASQTLEYSFTTDLKQNKWYQVFAVASNTDGVWSNVKDVEVLTDDTYAPTLEGVSPSTSQDPDQENSFSVDLTFSEPVQLTSADKFSFFYYFENEMVKVGADDVKVDGNVVTITQSKEPFNGEYVFLSYEEGAVTDFHAGTPNKVEAMVSVENGFPVTDEDGELVGLYWRVNHVAFELNDASFMPEVGSGVSDTKYKIEYKFPFGVVFPTDEDDDYVYEDGDISVTIWKNGKHIILDIPMDSISIVGDSTIVIGMTQEAEIGDWVSVTINEGVFEDMYGNPNAEYVSDSESGAYWLMSYNRDISVLVGSYKVAGNEYFSKVDESYDVTIWLDPKDDAQVLIKGLFGATDTLVGGFDKDFSILSIVDEQSLSSLNVGEMNIVTKDPFGNGVSEAFIDESGSFSMGYGSYDNNASWFKAFLTSTWTKQ